MTRGVGRPRRVYILGASRPGNRALAEALSSGVFLDAGTRHDFGAAPVWGTENWQRALATFAWGHDLAQAYRETAESRFLATWERLALSWIEAEQLAHDPIPLAAARVEHWIATWVGFASAPAFRRLSPGVGRRLLVSLAAHIARLEASLATETCTEPAAAHAIVLGVLAFPQLDPTGQRLAGAVDALAAYLGNTRRGDWVLGSVARQADLLKPLLGLLGNAGRFGFAVPRRYRVDLELACEVLLHARPMGATLDHPGAEVLACAAELFERSDFLWAATRGTSGAPPARRHVSFGRAGVHVQRSAWGNAPRFALFETGGPDVSSEPLRLALDTDGRSLVMRGGTNAAAQFLGRQSGPGIDILQGHAVDLSRDAWHDRQIAFVGDHYWLVSDRLHATGASRHKLRFEIDAPECEEPAVTLRDGTVVVAAPGLWLVIVAERALEVDLLRASKSSVTIVVTVHSVSDATITTLVMPGGPRSSAPTLEVREGGDATVAVIGGTGVDGSESDWIGWATAPAILEIGEFRVRATSAWLREAADGKVVAFGATELHHPSQAAPRDVVRVA